MNGASMHQVATHARNLTHENGKIGMGQITPFPNTQMKSLKHYVTPEAWSREAGEVMVRHYGQSLNIS